MDEMESALVVIREIISACRQQNSSQDNEKLKSIVREVMSENVSREQSKLLSDVLRVLNKDSVQSSREAEKTAMERDQLKKECEKLNMEMERLMLQSRQMPKKEERFDELSIRQKMLLQRVNEVKKANAGRGRSRSRQRNGAGDGNSATNQSQQQPGQPRSHGAFSKYPHHHHSAYRGNKNANTSYSNSGSRVYHSSEHHPGSYTGGQNAYGQQGQGPSMAHNMGAVGSQQQHTPPYQYPNPQGFSQYYQNPQHYQQSQPHNPYAGQPYKYGTQMSETYQQHQDGRQQQQQQQTQFGSSEAIPQQTGQHQQFHHRGQFQRGQFQHRGQFKRGGFNQQRDNFQPKEKRELQDDNSPMSQFTPEELNVLKEILKVKKQQRQLEENKDGDPNSQMKTGFKNKQKKKKKQQKFKPKKDEESKPTSTEVSDSSDDSDTEDNLDEMKKKLQDAFKAQLAAMGNEENKTAQVAQHDADADAKKPQAQTTRSNAANEKKEEAAEISSSAFDLHRATLDISKLKEGPELDAILGSMVLVAKTGGQPVTCHPKTFTELVEFKNKHPNAEVLLIK